MRVFLHTFKILFALTASTAHAEQQITVNMSLPVLKAGESDTFTATAGSDSGGGTVSNSVAGVLQFTLAPSGASGRYSTVTGSGSITRSGIGFDVFKTFRSLISPTFLSAVTSASGTCPSSSTTYNWIGFRFRPSDVSLLPMDASSANYLAGGSFTYDTTAQHDITGLTTFDLAGPISSAPAYTYDPAASSSCSDNSVKMIGAGAKPLDPNGTLLFGNNSLLWIGGSGNPLVAYGIPRATLSTMSGLAGYTLTGMYTEFTSRTAQTRKDIYMVPDGSGTTFALREATSYNDANTYSTLGTLTCTSFNSPSQGFCSGTLALNGVSGTGKAVCLPYLTSATDGNQNVLACAAQRPGTTWVYATIIAQTPPATRIAITPAVSAASAINTLGTGVYTVRNLSGRTVGCFGSPTFGSNSQASTANFSVTSNSCTSTLAGYGTCTVTVGFTSASYETLTDTFRLPYCDGTGATPNATAVAIGSAGLTSIAITPASGTYSNGSTDTLTATATYANGSTQNVSSVATWASSSTAVATISSSGGLTVASNANGTSSISATLGPISGSTTIAGYTPPPNPTGFGGSSSGTTITLNWTSGGGTTTGFRLAYESGATAPANCTTGTQSTLGNVVTTNVTNLVPGVQYSFRLCGADSDSPLFVGRHCIGHALRPYYLHIGYDLHGKPRWSFGRGRKMPNARERPGPWRALESRADRCDSPRDVPRGSHGRRLQ